MAKFLVSPPARRLTFSKGCCMRNLGDLLTATQVCQKWRGSILNDAQLWTTIEVTVQCARDVEALARVLGLSKKLPLHIRMEFERPSAASEEAALEQILGVSSRCAVLCLGIPHALYVGLVNRPAVFPILRRLLFLPIDSLSPEPS
ncbi:hypothetical protein BDZ89DRAFT_811612 [Hymenopellis radicata]|nr:hypothetical protein BDZ89DRAFT_811612 [Hymenopellis radicata]